MALRTILTEGSPELRKVCRPVTKFDDRLAQLLDDMLETMYASEGAGLAGPQIGILRRVFVMDCGDGPVKVVNPEILDMQGEQHNYEGCLSVPDKWGKTTRPQTVRLRYQDERGEACEMTAEGFTAMCICHENDHLDGKLYIDIVEGELLNKEDLKGEDE